MEKVHYDETSQEFFVFLFFIYTKNWGSTNTNQRKPPHYGSILIDQIINL
jgi:hypothetical protein